MKDEHRGSDQGAKGYGMAYVRLELKDVNRQAYM